MALTGATGGAIALALHSRVRRISWRWQSILVWIAVPTGITLLAWQPLFLQPAPGLDSSSGGALQMATHNGLVFGKQVVWTYGPLGFLTITELWHGHLGELAVLYTLL